MHMGVSENYTIWVHGPLGLALLRLGVSGVRALGRLGLRVNCLYGSFRKLGGTLFWGPYNMDPTI